MGARKTTVYWDSNCIIALFNNEPTTKEEHLLALKACFDDMFEGTKQIASCDLMYGEVFGPEASDEGRGVYDSLCAHRLFILLGLGTAVYKLAGELRDKCKSSRRSLKLPDALHVAAATLGRVDEFWTTEKKLVNYHRDGLLTHVPVMFPHQEQLRMTFD